MIIAPTTPLRLSVALEHAYPFGGMTVSGLRLEASRGRLTIDARRLWSRTALEKAFAALPGDDSDQDDEWAVS